MAPLRITMSTYQLFVLVTLMLAVALLEPVFGHAYLRESIQNRTKRSSVDTSQKYCGNNLSAALQLVCNGSYNTLFKRSYPNNQEMSDYQFSYDYAYPLRPRRSAIAMLEQLGARPRRQSDGVYEECCKKGCTQHELRTYCGP